MMEIVEVHRCDGDDLILARADDLTAGRMVVAEKS